MGFVRQLAAAARTIRGYRRRGERASASVSRLPAPRRAAPACRLFRPNRIMAPRSVHSWSRGDWARRASRFLSRGLFGVGGGLGSFWGGMVDEWGRGKKGGGFLSSPQHPEDPPHHLPPPFVPPPARTGNRRQAPAPAGETKLWLCLSVRLVWVGAWGARAVREMLQAPPLKTPSVRHLQK